MPPPSHPAHPETSGSLGTQTQDQDLSGAIEVNLQDLQGLRISARRFFGSSAQTCNI
eukprot:UN27780